MTKQAIFNDSSHVAWRKLLPAYATIEACGKDAQELYPNVAAHLSTCADCYDELEELLEFMIPVYRGIIEPAPTYPQPDLSFLRPAPALRGVPLRPPRAPQKEWIIDKVGRLLISFSQSLLDSLNPPVLAGAMRGQLLYSYSVESESPAIDCQIEIFSQDTAGKLATVEVIVDLPNHDAFDQAGSTVVLRTPATHERWEDETDEVGSVQFEGIPMAALPDLQIQVTPADG
jgi:hypothetical protein